MIATTIILTTILFLAAASYYDLKTGEIPDKISVGLLAAVLILTIAGTVTESYDFLINALLVGALYFVIGYISFYLGQLGGGDVKLLAGIGAAVATIPVSGFLPNYAAYIIDAGVVVMPYAAAYGLFLGLRNKSVFAEFAGEIKKIKIILLIILSFIPLLFLLLLSDAKINFTLILLTGILPVFVLLTAYLKVVEKTAMQKTIPVSELKEEDVPAEDIIVDGRKIAGKNDIAGITKEQLLEIRKLAEEGRIPDKITIKWGMKFVPVLFLGFLILVLYGNILEILFNV